MAKKPEMPVQMTQRAVLPQHILVPQTGQLTRSPHMDFDFLKRVTPEVNVPEFAGYNGTYVENKNSLFSLR